MRKAERFSAILSQLNSRKYLSVEELSKLIYVSPSTLRRDLAEMSRSGYLVRSHGGVMALTPSEAEDTVIHHSLTVIDSQQTAIAQRASEYIRNGDCIYLDSTRLVMAMVPMLKNKHRLTLVTNSLQLVLMLPEQRDRLFSLSGELSPRSLSVTGPHAAESAARFNYRIAFFSCSGISNGYATCNNLRTATLMKTVLERSEERILMCTREKAQHRTAINAIPLSTFTHIITDAPEAFADLNDRVEVV